MKMQPAKKMLNLSLVFAMMLVCWSAVVFACAPECDDCYTWNGSYCEWDCDEGEGCCNDSCCSNTCCNDVCCSEGENCCDGVSCFDSSTKQCCSHGDGTTCLKYDEQCCYDDTSGYCCETGETCCEGTCCDVCCKDSGNYCCDVGETCCKSVVGMSVDCCDCSDTNETAWQNFYFSGIGNCPASCTPDESDPEEDCCGNTLKLTCEPVSEYGGACAYEYWFNSSRVGLCVYTCGINCFQVKKNQNGSCRFLRTRHRTQDTLASGCDEGTTGKYDWQVYISSGGGYCREGTTVGWESDGDSSSCELAWW